MAGLAIAIGRVKPRVLEALLVRVECAAKSRRTIRVPTYTTDAPHRRRLS